VAVVERIFEQAQAAPGKAALIYNDRPLTYDAFAASIALARRMLQDHGVDRRRVAVLAMPTMRDAWIVGLALRSLGVTTVHLKPGDGLAQLGLDAMSVVSTPSAAGAGLTEAAARAGAPVILTPDELHLGVGPFRTGPETQGLATPGGHVLLTSGTTGAYKKVLIDADNEARNVPLRAAVMGLTSASTVNLFAFGGWTAYGYQWPVCAWSLGATVVIHQAPDAYRSLSAPGLTHAFTHPQLLVELLEAPAGAAPRNDAMALIVGAGVLPASLWRAARERLTHDVRTIIGSTEIGTFAMTRVEAADDLAWHRIVPAFQVQVVDDDDRILPPGRTGRVRVRTTGVDGYLDDPETTRQCFRDGFFYPGDLGVLREDGRLSLQGRVTDLINVMGDKIATGPIEAQLQDRLGAAAVCVFSHPAEEGEEVHVVIQPQGPVSSAELKAALIAALPGIVSVQVHVVTAFPRNHMGKIERAALKAQVLAGS
jgi:acyl-coenzyme A synthetase/AMP-(fatty) acid ligase